MAQNGTRATGPRCIALVGPFQSGKTTLLEAILPAPAQYRAKAPWKPENSRGRQQRGAQSPDER